MSAKARDRKGDPRRIPISDGGKRSGDEDPLKSSSELAEERAEALLSASGTDGPAPEGADRDEEAGGDLPPAPELLEKHRGKLDRRGRHRAL